MKTITMSDLRARVQAAKCRIGWTDDEAQIAALRNSGQNRTAAKRALLAEIEERARAAGLDPVPSNY